MSENHTTFNCVQPFARPTNALKAMECTAISIRKLLRKMEKTSGRRAWRELDDAVRLAVTIEAIASRAVNLPAADATDSVGVLELMLEELDQRLTRILAS